MCFTKKNLIFSFLFLIYSPFSSAFSFQIEWPQGSYKIQNKETPFSKMTPFSLRVKEENKAGSFSLEYFGGVVSPSLGGDTLHAVDVIAPSEGKYVFSAYNFRGQTKKGAIQLIELENDDITLSSEITFSDSDINAIHLDNEKLYFAGSDATGSFFSYAIIRKDKFVGISSKIYLSGYVATDITRSQNSIYITTADNGGVYSFYAGLSSADWFTSLFDIRSLHASPEDRFVYALSGQPAKIYRLNKSGQVIGTLELGGALTPESKSFLYKFGKYLYATVGEAGLKVVCDDEVVGELPSIILPGFDPSKTVTNALAVKSNLLFTASGEAGLYMYEKINSPHAAPGACNDVEFDESDHFNFWPEVSANHVALKNNYAFVASGAYGVQAFSTK